MIKKLSKKIPFILFVFGTFSFAQVTDSTKIAEAFVFAGNEFNKSQKYEKAITNYLKAVKVFEKLKDSAQLIRIYTNIGVVNARLKNLDKAILYLEKSLTYITNNENFKVQVLYNISGLYADKKEIDKALEIGKKTETLAKKLNNEVVLSNLYSNYCNIYRGLKQYSKSIDYCKKSLELKIKQKLNPEITINNLGYSLLLDKQFDNAIKNFNKIVNTENKNLQLLVYNNLKTANQEKNNTEIALEYANKLIFLKDSLTEAQQKVKVTSLIEKYESDKKQQQIDVLNIKNELQESKIVSQRNLFIGLGTLALLSLLLVYFWFKNQKTKQELNQASLQHKLLQTQLNPHFLFHSLNTIQSFIYQNKKEESANYLSNYSKLMRSILESSDVDFISIDNDSKAMMDYLELQKVNLQDNFIFTIHVDDTIKENVIPPMFIQPFIENAILHGIKSNDNGKVNLTYQDTSEAISVKIEDNGDGNKQGDGDNKLHKSMSSDIIKERIENLKKIHEFEITITTESNENGTIVIIKFPKHV